MKIGEKHEKWSWDQQNWNQGSQALAQHQQSGKTEGRQRSSSQRINLSPASHGAKILIIKQSNFSAIHEPEKMINLL